MKEVANAFLSLIRSVAGPSCHGSGPLQRVVKGEGAPIAVAAHVIGYVGKNLAGRRGHVCRIKKVTSATAKTRHKLFKPYTGIVDLNEIYPLQPRLGPEKLYSLQQN